MRPGATTLGGGRWAFSVWAPFRERMELRLRGDAERIVSLERGPRGYWTVEVEDLASAPSYTYLLDGDVERPDPASHAQPLGVHGPSRGVDHGAFPWTDGHWAGVAREDLVLYEVHVGAFTPEGTFGGILPRLPELRELGVTALELMPVAPFPGERNWGYDGTYSYGVQESYGGPEGLKRLVDACHREGLAVLLDVVYNHLGPEGNYLADFGPYFTDRYRTPWGPAVNFDGPWSDEVREFFLGNALHWIENYHLDGLRLDAVHAIYDVSARPFLQELAEAVDARAAAGDRPLHLVAESNRNDPRFVRGRDRGGLGLHAEWCDDLHHSLHALLTGEREGYYVDFGAASLLAKALGEGFVYSGQYSHYRQRRHGSSSADLPGDRFVVFAQNHDQVGNRMGGERLSTLIPFEALKLAAAVVLLSPYLPLLFMGEEYGEEAPFLYFVSHGDPDLVRAVREGRRAEFAGFDWAGEPPDPQAEATFRASGLRWETRHVGSHRVLLALHRELLGLRRRLPALGNLDKAVLEVWHRDEPPALTLVRSGGAERVLAAFNPSARPGEVPTPEGRWTRILDTGEERWQGPGAAAPEALSGPEPLALGPWSAALYRASGG